MIPNIAYVKFNSRRRFGVELELNQKLPIQVLAKIVAEADPKRSVIQSAEYAHSNNNNYWHVKFDRSCGDVENAGGWEIASYVGRGYKDVVNVGNVVKAVRDAGAVVNDHCAFHVHGEASDLSQNEVATLVAYWMKIEHILIEAVPKHRRVSKYCRLLTKKFAISPDKDYTATAFFSAIRPKSFSNPNRRVTLNICNYCAYPNRPTVELRLPEGTIDPKDARNWIRLFIHFIDVCKLRPFPANLSPVDLIGVLGILGLHGEEPFLILSRALRDTKMWFLQRIIKFATKRKFKETAEEVLYTLKVPEPEVYVPKVHPTTAELARDFWWRDEFI